MVGPRRPRWSKTAACLFVGATATILNAVQPRSNPRMHPSEQMGHCASPSANSIAAATALRIVAVAPTNRQAARFGHRGRLGPTMSIAVNVTDQVKILDECPRGRHGTLCFRRRPTGTPRYFGDASIRASSEGFSCLVARSQDGHARIEGHSLARHSDGYGPIEIAAAKARHRLVREPRSLCDADPASGSRLPRSRFQARVPKNRCDGDPVRFKCVD